MSHYRPYPAYKDSGVQWLGNVPSHWEIAPLWSVYRPVKRTGFTNEPLLSVYRDYGVVLKASRDDNRNRASDDLGPYQLVEPGQLVTNKMKTWQGSIAVSELRGIVSPAYFIYEPIRNVFGRFIHHLMRCRPYIAGYLSISKGIRVGQWDLDPDHFRTFPVLFPPEEEQERIVMSLDRETARIDALIAKKTEFIELLAKKRQALITHAVTKGLNPNAKMKDSGVEWIGEVPEHWMISKLKYVSRALIGLTYAPEDVVSDGSGITVLRSSNIQDGQLDLADIVQVRKVVDSELMAQVGDILICSRNGSRALIGKNIQLDERSLGCTFGAFMTVVRGSFNDYLYFVFNSTMFDANSALYMTSTVNQLTISMIANMEVPFPPEAEQKAIISEVRNRLLALDTLLSKTQLSVGLLKKRRSALITAAVTGQIDLRESA